LWREPRGFLYKFNKAGLVWQLPLGASSECSPAIDTDGTIYIGCEDGNLRAVTSGGALKWKFRASSKEINGAAAIGDDHTVYFTTRDFKLWAIDPLAPAKSRKWCQQWCQRWCQRWCHTARIDLRSVKATPKTPGKTGERHLLIT
jgi:hypothetical protein